MIEDILAVKQLLHDVVLFSQHASGTTLRRYQIEVARAVVDSIIHRRGLSFVVMFPRQSGKNELQAQLETYLLVLFSLLEAEMVKVSPTWKPQSLNAMRRLQRALNRNILVRTLWKKESGYIFRVGSARIAFLSGDPNANIVGATANLLLECDEAQDVQTAKWDKDVAPMAASTNATRVFWGTAWTSKTLLARELRLARQAEKQDGVRRAFVLTANEVAAEVPAYGRFVAEQVAKLGRSHPLVRTQFFSEEIDAEGGMFPPARRALMQGSHSRRESPEPGKVYALLLDVAGEDESRREDGSEAALGGDAARNVSTGISGRDSTALTVVEVDLSTLADELIKAPRYKVVQRWEWVGVRHTRLYGQVRLLAEHWSARWLVVDATGVGAGLASFLEKALPGKLIPFIFTSKSKSDLGWAFLAVVETGRYQDYSPSGESGQVSDLPKGVDETFWRQVEHAQVSILEGPGKLMRWGVPDGTRDPATGALVHDDLLISAALCAVLDAQEWGLAASTVIPAADALAGLGEVF